MVETIPKHCDVVVIGGGPAGSMAATFLCQLGYEVVLLEKKKHPRYNVGESLIPHFWKYCDIAGVSEKIEAEGFIKKQGGTVVWDGVIRQLAFKDFGYTRTALHVERDRFDQILLEHARSQGAEVFEDVSVIRAELDQEEQASVEYRTDGERSPDKISCRFIIDASGQSAVIARQLGIRMIDEGFRFMSVWGYFRDSRYIALGGRAYEAENLRAAPPTTFISSIGGWGWLWHIPLRESTSVGLVIPVEQVREVKSSEEALEKYFLRRCSEIPILDRLLENARYCEDSFHVIRDYSYRPIRLAGPGFFLIGDAAAFVDPIFSVGVPIGMFSGYLSAWAVDRSFRDPRRTEQNRAMFESQFRGRLELARSLALPRYGAEVNASDLARRAIQVESSIEQELMFAASTVITRNENFLGMVQDVEGRQVTSERFRTLDEIIF